MFLGNRPRQQSRPPPHSSTEELRTAFGTAGRWSYHELVIDPMPMRKVLDREGRAGTAGLRHALHIWRGHFKTYTAEAPLFGRLTARIGGPIRSEGAPMGAWW